MISGPVPILSLRSLEVHTPVLDEALAFYTEVWGLTSVESDRDAVWLRASGPEHHVLALRRAPIQGLGKITFSLPTADDVDRTADYLETLSLPLICEPGPSEDPGGGYGLITADNDGRRIELLAETTAVARQDISSGIPLRVTHVVLNTPDIDVSVAFWVDVFGFRVSDWSEHQMAFLRCNSYHHTIAFNQAAWSSVNHVAYEMSDIDSYMRGIGRATQEGHPPAWGPGRHGPGDNTFAYFVDPSGFVCEYTAEVALVDEETWIPRTWPRTPQLSDTWGTAGPPSAHVREHMAGLKDLGVLPEHPELAGFRTRPRSALKDRRDTKR